jgi:hypothetical protein
MAIDITAITGYVEQRRLPIIRNAVIGAKSLKYMRPNVDVKGKAVLNLLNTEANFNDGSECGWNDTTEGTFTQRTIETGQIAVNMSLCDKALANTWMGYEVKAGLVGEGEKAPFEEDLVNGIVENVQANLEKGIWQGDKTSQDGNLNKFDGFGKVTATGTIGVTYATTDTASKIIGDVYAALPAEVFSKGDVVIYVSDTLYRKYVQELIAANLFHFVEDAKTDYIVLPGDSRVKVIGTAGLDGTTDGEVYASYAENFNFGTDLVGDTANVDAWYSKDNREFRFAMDFNFGVQVAFPGLVVKATHP